MNLVRYRRDGRLTNASGVEASQKNLAERVGFEPTEPVKAHSISNAANSTTLAPFRTKLNCQNYC